MSSKRKTLTVEFKDYDADIYEFLKTERNKSALIKHLLRNYMTSCGVQTIPQPVYVQPQPVYNQPVYNQQPIERKQEVIEIESNCEPKKFTKKEVPVSEVEEDQKTIENRKQLEAFDL